jgi:hypothetical protein
MINIPEEYTVSKFFQYAHQPKFNRYNQTYQGGCCICKEGGSLGKKRRFYYIPKKDNLFCHNCGWSSKPLKWILEVSGMTFLEIVEELKQDDFTTTCPPEDKSSPVIVKSETLPTDCINLFDQSQVSYYGDNSVIQKCINLIKSRKIDIAVNRPKKIFISLNDKVHKNRLVIPFINELNEIEFYQTRGFLDKDIKTRPKYISKINAEKTLFNIDQVSSDFDSVYIFEGPINAFFTRNSIAVAGITDKSSNSFTRRQKAQLENTLRWYNKIWVLDSQWIDTASLNKSEILLKEGNTVFIWPEKYGRQFKDFNDICMEYNINEIKHNFIQKNSFSGIEGILRLSDLKRNLRVS